MNHQLHEELHKPLVALLANSAKIDSEHPLSVLLHYVTQYHAAVHIDDPEQRDFEFVNALHAALDAFPGCAHCIIVNLVAHLAEEDGVTAQEYITPKPKESD